MIEMIRFLTKKDLGKIFGIKYGLSTFGTVILIIFRKDLFGLIDTSLSVYYKNKIEYI